MIPALVEGVKNILYHSAASTLIIDRSWVSEFGLNTTESIAIMGYTGVALGVPDHKAKIWIQSGNEARDVEALVGTLAGSLGFTLGTRGFERFSFTTKLTNIARQLKRDKPLIEELTQVLHSARLTATTLT